MSRISIRVELETDDPLYQALRDAAVDLNRQGGPRFQERDVLRAVLTKPEVRGAIETALEGYGTDPAEAQAEALEAEAAELERKMAADAAEKRARAEELRNPPEDDPGPIDEMPS